MDLLRLATAGSVDDGKSTLIGRLLFDSKAILADQLAHVEAASADGEVDLALLTDGLRAEREQGITIDVAYRHFATARRRFILADTPGHAQYTRNMVTGASTAELALVLVDVRHGMTEQTRRHLSVATLLGVRHVVVAVNKMDLADYAEEPFDEVVRAVLDFTAKLGLEDVEFIPLSALKGDNVIDQSTAMPWYDGPPLLEYLETVPVGDAIESLPARLPVQTVLRGEDRWYAGRLSSGTVKVGDDVAVLPSGLRTRVTGVSSAGTEVERAEAPLSVAVRLADQVDAGRGDVIVAADDQPLATREIEAAVCWLGDRPASPAGRYLLKQGARTVRAKLDEITSRLDLEHGVWSPTDGLALNDVGTVRVRTGTEVVVDPYDRIRGTGGFVLIDEQTNETVAAGMVR
jgi:sulfate adenylyltransferase large subunit